MNDFFPAGITVKQLKAFVAIAQSRSFAEACELVHLSQPALSIAIKNLEQALGGQLLQRSTRTVNLSPEGQEFYKVASRLIADWDQALSDVHTLFAMKRGRLVMAAMPSYASSLLPLALRKYRECYPDINIRIDDVIAESVVDLVRSGRAEIGVTFEPPEADDLDFQPLFADKFVAVLPPGHSLCQQAKLKWPALQRFDFIALQKPSSIRRLIDDSLTQTGMEPLVPAFETHQLATIGRMVVSGLGVSVVPALSQHQMLEMGAECRPVIAPVISRNVGVIYRRRYPLSVAAQAMLEVLGQQ